MANDSINRICKKDVKLVRRLFSLITSTTKYKKMRIPTVNYSR